MEKIRKIAICLSAIFSLLIVSCNTHDNKDSKDIAEDRNEAKFNKGEEKDAEKVVDAYELSIYEVRLTDSMQKHLIQDEVKTVARQIIDDHMSMANQIKSLASKKVITLPDALSQDRLDKINNMLSKKNSNYDKEYIDQLIEDHKKAINIYEEAAKDSKDADIQSWFSSELPQLRKHLDMLTATHEKIKSIRK
jgi:putative membrane protein